MKKLLASAAIALALAGCSDATEGSPEPADTMETIAKLHGSYNSVAELKDRAIAAGYDCAEWTDGSWNQGSCSDADFFGVFTNPGSRSAHMHQTQAAGESFTALVGDNWYISGDEAALSKIVDELNGTIEKVEGAPQDEAK